jgi:hypothetical protein
MNVKVFFGESPAALESEIKAWIKKNPNRKVIHACQCETTDPSTMITGVCLTIFYT